MTVRANSVDCLLRLRLKVILTTSVRRSSIPVPRFSRQYGSEGTGKTHHYTMKKFLLLTFFAATTLHLSAQSEVTKFLGIPVDGTKSAMIEKLKAKGFTWNARQECLEGEFNGEDVYLRIVTNNGKVRRVFVVDKYNRSEGQIRIRFNNLVSQFERNDKYEQPSLFPQDYTLSDDEDISYEMTVHSKQYQASYCQMPQKRDVDSMSDEEKEMYEQQRYDALMNNIVWFKIGRDINEYYICIYYDNERNDAQGEDL